MIWHIPAAIVGYFVPLELASKTLLMQELKGYGVPALPLPCIEELAAFQLLMARQTAKFGRGNVRGNLVSGTEFLAEYIAEIMGRCPIAYDGPVYRERRAQIADVLVRHGVQLPGPLSR